jgi:hypothetical protein
MVSHAQFSRRLVHRAANFSARRTLQIHAMNVSENFWRSLAAVLIGNALYYACSGYLPPPARHNTAGVDLGLAVDFWFCLVVLGLLKLRGQHKKTLRPPR